MRSIVVQSLGDDNIYFAEMQSYRITSLCELCDCMVCGNITTLATVPVLYISAVVRRSVTEQQTGRLYRMSTLPYKSEVQDIQLPISIDQQNTDRLIDCQRFTSHDSSLFILDQVSN